MINFIIKFESEMKKEIFVAIKMLIAMMLITGIFYPLIITIAAQLIFPDKANGSIIYKNDKSIGSSLLGQKFTSDRYFHPRPSAVEYNPLPSGASNLSLTSSVLLNQFNERKHAFTIENELTSSDTIPTEMLFASASGVDPHISKKAAYLQAKRIAKIRNLNEKIIVNLIDNETEYPQLGILGNEVVNVLKLNLKLDVLSQKGGGKNE